MEDHTSASSHGMETVNGSVKRKRSISAEAPAAPAPPAKTAKTHSSHLQINYLVRQYSDILPLVSADDTMPSILQTLQDYGQVLERHESLAGNLGARPLGPILIKRFERLFDGAPRVLKSHGKEGTTVTWLDVVEFARHKPEQFNLEKMRDGVRVCQFYTKQSRVEISEEDFLLISSGMPQKLIPPQPIAEDEEKELGTLEIMEKSVLQVIQLADQVSARARQTKHRLTGRKNAIASRREAEAAEATRANSEGRENGNESPSGFTAVNALRPKEGHNSSSNMSNGKTYTGASASPTTRAELINCFTQQRERMSETANEYTPTSSRSHAATKSKSKLSNDSNNIDYASILLNSASPVPIPNTPSNLVNYPRPTQQERLDDSGPYKAEMLSRMDAMQRGDRVMPPCDRCRRLHMDCLKNLTACQGCTRKHAKCSWKDVTEQELADNPHPRKNKDDSVVSNGGDDASLNGGGESAAQEPTHDPEQPVRDEELLGEDDSDDEEDQSSHGVTQPATGSASSPPNSSTTAQATAGPREPPKSGSNGNIVPQMAHEDVQEAASEIIKKRLAEPVADAPVSQDALKIESDIRSDLPTSNSANPVIERSVEGPKMAGPGFASVNGISGV